MLKLGLFCFVILGFARPGVSESAKRSHHNSAAWNPSHCWDHASTHLLDPFCAQLKECKRPPAIANGAHSEPDLTLHGTQVTYFCNSGYYMSGEALVMCPTSASMMSKPKWGPVPSCKKACPPIPTIDNGFYADTNTTEIGTLVEYSCIKGYNFENVSTVECLDNGQWSLPLPVCLPPDCYPIPNVDNGYPVGLHNSTVYGSVVNYECDAGYLFTDTNQTKCLITGYWSVLPECVKNKCDPFPVVENGNITEADNNTEVGAMAMYACATGYELVGNETIECLPTFEWTAVPVCEPVCNDPPQIKGGNIISTISTHNGDSVQYNCSEDGFKPTPTDTITCENGTWSAVPSCFKPCNDSDIVFLLDSSGSVGTPGFLETKKFVEAMVEKYPLDKTHFGMATFSTGVKPQFNLNTFSDKAQLLAAVNSTNYTIGSTQTDLALEYARTTMLQPKNGRRPDAIPAVIIVTDGVASNRTETVNQAQLLKDQGVAIYSVAVGPETDPRELQQIASKSEYVFNVEKYSAITTVTGPLSEALCNV